MKNTVFSLSVLMLTLMGVGAFSTFSEEEPSFELVWQDEFDGNELDTNAWTPIVGDGCPQLCGWGNNELQFYHTNNIRVADGKLIIEAQKEKMGAREYTSGKLVTKNKADWKYGKIEIRAMLPYGTGTWPAIWMLPTINDRDRIWPDDGEIDIMEHVGYNHGVVYGTVHTGKYNGMYGTHKPDSILLKDAHEAFHTYSIVWTEENITWYADNQAYHKLEKGKDAEDGWPFNQFEYHLILNLAVGGNWGGKYGIDEKIWPQRLTVDYVRYYELKE